MTLVALREAARRGRADADPLAVLDAETILRAAEDRGLMLQPDGAGFAAYLEGEPVDAEIRGARVTGAVSAVSAVPVVREWVNTRLRAMVRAGRDVVVDGRDIGTVVFPDADLKIFLTASPETRAGRRVNQRGLAPDPAQLEAEAMALAARDQADSTPCGGAAAAGGRRGAARHDRAHLRGAGRQDRGARPADFRAAVGQPGLEPALESSVQVLVPPCVATVPAFIITGFLPRHFRRGMGSPLSPAARTAR